jgi:hypothetical protein
MYGRAQPLTHPKLTKRSNLTRITQPYDRRANEVTLDEVERVEI